MTVAYGYIVLDICGVLWVAVGIFGRWRVNPGGYFRFHLGVGYDLCSHLGNIYEGGRVDLYFLATNLVRVVVDDY